MFLLFIAMGVDENYKGVPLAFFLFSTPTGNKATHAGYDTSILHEFLISWQDSLGNKDGSCFKPSVTITDTDTNECAALTLTGPDIYLLLCRFHVCQCWSNHHKKTSKTWQHSDVLGYML